MSSSRFLTRGVVLIPSDLTWRAWPARAKAAGLTTIALHPTPGEVAAFVRSEAGQRFLLACRELGLEVEYELHAMRELLPRELFADHPHLFRMNENAERTPDANLCVHSQEALDFAAENALAFAQVLRPTTHRYYYWGDDAKPWCRCPRCRGFSDSEQALILEHAILKALRTSDPEARLAHLAYYSTMEPPRQIAPEPGLFLEYAPIRRSYDRPFAGQEAEDTLEALEANLAVFPRETAQVLEYWLDVSRFSGWERPGVELPWRSDVHCADLAAYASRGLRHATTFAAWLDADYVAKHGEPPVGEYGAGFGLLG